MRIPDKKYKKKNDLYNNSNLDGHHLKKDDIEEEEGLIKNNNKRNANKKLNINYISTANSTFQIKTIKISFILILVFIMSLLLLLKNIIFIPNEVINLKD